MPLFFKSQVEKEVLPLITIMQQGMEPSHEKHPQKGFRLPAYLIAVCLLVPYGWLALYQHPAADDFHFAVPTAAWGPLTTVMGQYKAWSARYTSVFFIAVNPLSWHSLWGYRAFSLLLLTLLPGSFWFFISQLFEISASKQRLLAVFCLAGFLGIVQTLPEAIYNSGSYVPYMLGGAFFLFLQTFFLLALRKGIYQHHNLKNIFFWTIQSGFIFLVIGFNELFMALQLGFWAALFFFWLLYKKRFSIPYLMFLVAALAGTLVVLLSPATFYRMEASGSFNRSFSWVFLSSFKAWLGFIRSIMMQPGLMIFFIFCALMPCKSGFFTFSPKEFLLSLLTSLLVLLFCFFPSFKGEGTVQHHTLNLFQFLTICLVIWNIFVAKSAGIRLFSGLKYGYKHASFYKWMFIMGLIFLLNPNQRTAVKDLISGEAMAYEKERSARMKYMEMAKGDSVWVEPYRHFPVSFLSSELGEGPGQWYDNVYAQYFGKRFVHLKETKENRKNP